MSATPSGARPPLPHVAGVRHSQVPTARGLRIHVAEAGSGLPLVLLHGWPQHWYAWRHVIPALAVRHRVLCPDLRGQGWTEATRAGYDKQTLAGDLLGLLDALSLPVVTLVGHDWGGWVGMLAAMDHPERFAGVIALGVVHPWQRPDVRLVDVWRFGYQLVLAAPLLGVTVVRLPGVIPALLRAGAARTDVWAPADLEAYAAPLRQAERAAASVALYRRFVVSEGPRVLFGRFRDRRLDVPTRILVGDRDPFATSRLLAGWSGHGGDLHVMRIRECGHFVPEERPDVVLQAVRDLSRSV